MRMAEKREHTARLSANPLTEFARDTHEGTSLPHGASMKEKPSMYC